MVTVISTQSRSRYRRRHRDGLTRRHGNPSHLVVTVPGGLPSESGRVPAPGRPFKPEPECQWPGARIKLPGLRLPGDSGARAARRRRLKRPPAAAADPPGRRAGGGPGRALTLAKSRSDLRLSRDRHRAVKVTVVCRQ
jgi:hypothetical protein